MPKIETIAALEALYGVPSQAAVRKVAKRLTPMYRRWIEAARFCVLATVGPQGTDASPRGDDGPVVLELDPGHVAIPDWRGNNRLDSLRNIVLDGRVSLMFMVPGENTVVRINGRAWVSDDMALREKFTQRATHPATVTVVEIAEVYSQCPKALMRSGLWARNDKALVPTLGQILSEMTDGEIGAEDWDKNYPKRAGETLW
ncbi:pyridoxamine 5'-phosphate oxidase [Litorivita pollutaquae]|uniref:Pyridoxamine 5'-phosphate oxidase n=1 Tax=Litorivita pollutaquae TaxID=2200892 RepID=A0A2V4MMA1_9RHOB|nr:pyridoxamine 5'-phosphate oxidase family protein [Litorivita pollutaquae]PYC47821.1 pyridoxamine 5'-phosphate oxidase [Litorivita pollutaquae]